MKMKHAEPFCRKLPGQVSLEMLLLLAAIASLTAVLLPAYSQAREKAALALADRAQEKAFAEVRGTAGIAEALGIGSKIEREVILLADETEFYFDAQTRELGMRYKAGNKTRESTEKVSFDIVVSNGFLKRGKTRVVAENNGTVKIGFQPKSI